uniref:Ferredoxin n=1 Tax=Psalteriomonas lanterna TaxID=31290 RepID=FER_PSALA|nr:RecName: Full=Ferredoxin; Flags: Precursor [Psalteriomonas lanterna]CAA52650.1 ferredoxin [Psalteriomonas lanterna]
MVSGVSRNAARTSSGCIVALVSTDDDYTSQDVTTIPQAIRFPSSCLVTYSCVSCYLAIPSGKLHAASSFEHVLECTVAPVSEYVKSVFVGSSIECTGRSGSVTFALV